MTGDENDVVNGLVCRWKRFDDSCLASVCSHRPSGNISKAQFAVIRHSIEKI